MRSNARSLLILMAALAWAVPGSSSHGQEASAATTADELNSAIAKSNAYIELMNRTLRAAESWSRYTSWVNLKTGPTGKERYIDYGLYGLYDVRDEIDKAKAATGQPPRHASLDETVRRYIDAYQTLAPLITQANGYYERKDYKTDKAAEGKALHARMVPAAQAFLRERTALEAEMTAFKSEVDAKSLAAIEAAEGKGARWQVKNVMIEAGRLMELLPSSAAPVVEMKTFDAALSRYASAVKDLDTFAQSNPGKLSVLESQPRSLLGKMRDMRDKLAKAKGDARKGAGRDLIWIINDYNMMISTASSVARFSR